MTEQSSEDVVVKAWPTGLDTVLEFNLKWANWPGKRFDVNTLQKDEVLTFSILGLNADEESEKAYIEWEAVDGELGRLVDEIHKAFPTLVCVKTPTGIEIYNVNVEVV